MSDPQMKMSLEHRSSIFSIDGKKKKSEDAPKRNNAVDDEESGGTEKI